MPASPVSQKLIRAATALCEGVDALSFAPPVSHVYNPLRYAWAPHELYLRRYGGTQKRVLLLGMNPGPFGMAQTGVPFGEVAAVRDWMGINAKVNKPANESAGRPIEGFAWTRSEVSGRRLWGLFARRFKSPEDFFGEHFVVNYCPLAFLEGGTRNRTPDKLPAAEFAPLMSLCDAHLRVVVETLRPEFLVGVGGFARKRLEALFAAGKARIGTILHPSPASPAANRGWEQVVEKQLVELGVW